MASARSRSLHLALLLLPAAFIPFACHGTSTPPLDPAALSACGQLYDSQYANPDCIGLIVPPAETARRRQRYAEVCARELALPGVRLTPADLSALAIDNENSSCGEVSFAPVWRAGDSVADASCLSDWQCQSGSCVDDTPEPDGGPSGCKTCYAPRPYDAGPPSAEGETCTVASDCAGGLYCGVSPDGGSTCRVPLEPDAACGYSDICAPPLQCVSGSCQSRGLLGASCYTVGAFGNGYCAAGLACEPDGGCGPVTWGAPGDYCGLSDPTGLTHCLTGICALPPPVNRIGVVYYTCPTILSDGQPCDPDDTTRVCDVFATCTNGTCIPEYTQACQ